MNSDPFAPVMAKRKKLNSAASSAMAIVTPVPPDAPAPLARHPKLGTPTEKYTYTDVTGSVIGYVLRFDAVDGKEFRPLTLWRPTHGEAAIWRWESWPALRPLYNLHQLGCRPSAPVLVCEGEKAADAAGKLLPGHVAVTSPNGSKSAGKADWSVLQDRVVTVWPDADVAGMAYAEQVAQLAVTAGAAMVKILMPPTDVGAGWDAADARAEAWTTEQTLELINSAVPVSTLKNDLTKGVHKSGGGEKVGRRHRTPQRDALIGLCEDIELWHDAGRTAYVSFQVNGHREHWPVRSRDFRMYLSGRFYRENGSAIGSQALEDTLRIFEAQAVHDGPAFEAFLRTGFSGETLFLDLCDARWRAIEITALGWRVIDNPPIKFLRSPSMRALPEPEGGSLIEELRRFLNVKTDEDFRLTVAFLVAALRPRGPYPILVLNGEAGTGKSLFSTMLKMLVDPSMAPIRALPRDDRDLFVSASNSLCLAFDNISNMPAWVADALCRLATGSGFATRTLQTDREETIFEVARPMILNGIPNLTDRADLADRAMTIHLSPISHTRPEEDMLREFNEARPRILGALLDAVSRAIANVANTKIERAPRLADFAKWITAAEPGLGWEPGSFLAAYNANRRDEMESSFEADPVAMAIYDLVTTKRVEGFRGTATQLLNELNAIAPEYVRKSRTWPNTPARLGDRVARAAPVLTAKGCFVDRGKSGSRYINVIPPKCADTVAWDR